MRFKRDDISRGIHAFEDIGILNPKHLLRLASGTGRGRPCSTDLRRAVSSAYYALFHLLSQYCADMLVGATKAPRSQAAWLQAYRSLDHSYVKNQCSKLSRLSFPPQIRRFGELFVEMQKERERADYDPETVFNRNEVLQRIKEVEKVIEKSGTTDNKDLRAFAVLVALKRRR